MVLTDSKYKIRNQQNGQIYLTSHRICYVDKADPRRYSAAVDLKDVEKYDFYVGSRISAAEAATR